MNPILLIVGAVWLLNRPAASNPTVVAFAAGGIGGAAGKAQIQGPHAPLGGGVYTGGSGANGTHGAQPGTSKLDPRNRVVSH